MKLTPTQIEILMHRIEVGTIPEVLADSDMGITEQEAEQAQAKLELFIKGGYIPYSLLSRVEREVLKDAMDGSTFFACAEGARDNLEITAQKVSALNRAADNLEAQWKMHTGERISIPRC